jgi:hypothetical protein
MIGHLAQTELEDVIGVLLKTGAFRVLSNDDSAVVTLANKLEPTAADREALRLAREALRPR